MLRNVAIIVSVVSLVQCRPLRDDIISERSNETSDKNGDIVSNVPIVPLIADLNAYEVVSIQPFAPGIAFSEEHSRRKRDAWSMVASVLKNLYERLQNAFDSMLTSIAYQFILNRVKTEYPNTNEDQLIIETCRIMKVFKIFKLGKKCDNSLNQNRINHEEINDVTVSIQATVNWKQHKKYFS